MYNFEGWVGAIFRAPKNNRDLNAHEGIFSIMYSGCCNLSACRRAQYADINCEHAHDAAR